MLLLKMCSKPRFRTVRQSSAIRGGLYCGDLSHSYFIVGASVVGSGFPAAEEAGEAETSLIVSRASEKVSKVSCMFSTLIFFEVSNDGGRTN